MRMYQECFNERLQRRDRMAPNKFMGKTLELMVVSIDKDSNKNPLAEINHYSRVKKILSILVIVQILMKTQKLNMVDQ